MNKRKRMDAPDNGEVMDLHHLNGIFVVSTAFSTTLFIGGFMVEEKRKKQGRKREEVDTPNQGETINLFHPNSIFNDIFQRHFFFIEKWSEKGNKERETSNRDGQTK